MELIALAFMLVGGTALAAFVLTAMAIAKRTSGDVDSTQSSGAVERDRLAASLLYQVMSAGGTADDEVLRMIRRGAGIAAPVTRGVDVGNWAETFARVSDGPARARLLETAVGLVARQGRAVPLRQYSLLLDLSFGLGFQTDALARLREQYGFEYVDNARNARPREADRSGGGAPLFVREPRRREELLRLLGLSEDPGSRAAVIAAYRRLAAQHHPDRFHGTPEHIQSEAAGRFIEITRAYEELLLQYRD